MNKKEGIFSSLLSEKEFQDRSFMLNTFFLAKESMPWGLLPLNVQELRGKTGKKWRGEEKIRKNEQKKKRDFLLHYCWKKNSKIDFLY